MNFLIVRGAGEESVTLQTLTILKGMEKKMSNMEKRLKAVESKLDGAKSFNTLVAEVKARQVVQDQNLARITGQATHQHVQINNLNSSGK